MPIDMTGSAVGYFALGIFVLAYALVMAEEFTHLRKSKPVILAAGIIWALVAWSYPGNDPACRRARRSVTISWNMRN